MILVDANLLVYAVERNFPQHDAARSWLDGRLGGTAAVGLPWPSLLAFVRLMSDPRAIRDPLPVPAAWEVVQGWLSQAPSWTPCATERHEEIFSGLVPQVTRSRLVPDAHLAALAIEHGLVLCSVDTDFARFSGLRWENPLSTR